MRNINAAENKDKLKQFSQKEAQIVTDFFKNMGEIIIKMDGYVIKDAGEKLIEKSPEENNNINVNEQKEVEEEKEKEKEKEQGISENEEKNSNDNIENNIENNVENKNEINENNNKS